MNHLPSNSQAPSAGRAIPLVDVRRAFDALEADLVGALVRVANSGQYIGGPDVRVLEESLASYCKASHAVACASGSDALLLALMACGIGPGDEVLTPSYTFFATASAVWRLGARPVFVDIDPATFNIDPRLLPELITPRTKAIIPVHLFGQCADMEPICRLAEKHGLWVIEDAAQAIGAEYAGHRAGRLGDIACFSFYPTKNLGAMGDGGLLTTSRADLAKSLRLLASHGMEPRYHHQVVGINSRLDSMQAAVLNVKLSHLERWTAERAAIATRYDQLFRQRGLDQVLVLPGAAPNCLHVWNQYVVRVADGRRDALREHLRSWQIGSEVYYPVPLHLQACFRGLGYGPGSLHESERAAAETVALPIFPGLTAEEQAQVALAIATFFEPASPTIAAPKFLKHTPAPAIAPSFWTEGPAQPAG